MRHSIMRVIDSFNIKPEAINLDYRFQHIV